MSKLRLIISLFTALCTSQAHAVSLKEAVASLYNVNPQLKGEQLKVKEANAFTASMFFAMLPSAEYSKSMDKYGHFSNSYSQERTERSTASTFRVQEQISLGSLAAKPGYAKKSADAQAVSSKINIQNILLEGISAYLTVIRDQKLLEAANSNMEILNKYRTLVLERFKLKEVTKTDLGQVETRLASSIAVQQQTEGELEAAKATYNRIFLLSPDSLKLPELLPKIPKNLSDFQNIARKSNLNILLADLNVDVAKFGLANTTNSSLPYFALEYRTTDSDFSHLGQMRERRYEANLVMPILPNGGAEYAKIVQSKLTLNRSNLDRSNSRLQLEESIYTEWERFIANKASLNSANAAVKYAQEAVDAIGQEVSYGSRSVLDLLNTQLEYFRAKTEAIRIQTAYILSYYRILAVCGVLDKEFI